MLCMRALSATVVATVVLVMLCAQVLSATVVVTAAVVRGWSLVFSRFQRLGWGCDSRLPCAQSVTSVHQRGILLANRPIGVTTETVSLSRACRTVFVKMYNRGDQMQLVAPAACQTYVQYSCTKLATAKTPLRRQRGAVAFPAAWEPQPLSCRMPRHLAALSGICAQNRTQLQQILTEPKSIPMGALVKELRVQAGRQPVGPWRAMSNALRCKRDRHWKTLPMSWLPSTIESEAQSWGIPSAAAHVWPCMPWQSRISTLHDHYATSTMPLERHAHKAEAGPFSPPKRGQDALEEAPQTRAHSSESLDRQDKQHSRRTGVLVFLPPHGHRQSAGRDAASLL